MTTKRRSASSRSSGRSGSGGSRGATRSKGARPKAASGPGRTRASGSGRDARASGRSGEVVREGLLWDHAADLCAVGLITLGVLVALAAYGNALGPVGHWLDSALGDLIGVVRFLVPPILVASGAAIIAVRGRPDPVRSLVGALLGLVAVTGLAELAGGRPPVDGSTHALSEAGGWLGALIGRPLSEGLGVAGAAVLLVALFVVAFLLATGISLRTAVRAIVRAGRSVVRGVAAASASRRQDAPADDPDGPPQPAERGGAEPWAEVSASPGRVPFDGEAQGLGPPPGRAAGTLGEVREAEGDPDLEGSARWRPSRVRRRGEPRLRPRGGRRSAAGCPPQRLEEARTTCRRSGGRGLGPAGSGAARDGGGTPGRRAPRGGGRPIAGGGPRRARRRDPPGRPHRRTDGHPLRARARHGGEGGEGDEPVEGHRLRDGLTRRAHPRPHTGKVGDRRGGAQRPPRAGHARQPAPSPRGAPAPITPSRSRSGGTSRAGRSSPTWPTCRTSSSRAPPAPASPRASTPSSPGCS